MTRLNARVGPVAGGALRGAHGDQMFNGGVVVSSFRSEQDGGRKPPSCSIGRRYLVSVSTLSNVSGFGWPFSRFESPPQMSRANASALASARWAHHAISFRVFHVWPRL